MNSPTLQAVAKSILQKAQNQEYVLKREIRKELEEAGLPPELWKEVVKLIHSSLQYRHGRFYFKSPPPSRLQQEHEKLQKIRETLQEFLALHREKEEHQERRGEERVSFIRPIKVQTEDQHELNVLSQDISVSGIRLISNRSLLGRKIRLFFPSGEEAGSPPVVFVTRILWSSAIADGLYENGGLFLELSPSQQQDT